MIQFLLLDSITALWITGLSLFLLIGLPSKILFDPQSLAYSDRWIESLAKSILLLVTGVLILSALSLFNWFTLVFWYVSGLFIFKLIYDPKKTLAQMQLLLHGSLLCLFDILDQQISWSSVQQQIRSHLIVSQKSVFPPKPQNQGLRSEFFSTWVALTIILSFTLLLRYEHPLLEVRFSHSDSYQALLTTRQILAGGTFSSHTPPVFVAIAAVLALFGSVDPMQAVRFLSPLLGVALVVTVGYGMYTLMKNGVAALVSMLSLGAYWFTCTWDISNPLPSGLQQYLATLTTQLNADLVRQWTGTDPELGAMFLILAITQLHRGLSQPHRSAWIAAGCCSAIVALTAPQLLLLAVLGILGLVINRRWALGIVALAWLSLGLLAPLLNSSQLLQPFLMTLPVALSLLCGYVFNLLNRPFQLLWADFHPSIGLLLIFAIFVNFLLPLSPPIAYLEHDIAARETLVLNARLSAKQWMLIAPIEQLSETYGEAWYGDLAEFVDTYTDSVQQTDFNFPFSIPDLFVFVEKKPFKTFPIEPSNISGESAFDPVYRNYRTFVGRSSLQSEAMKLCETYRQTHPDSSIEYEDHVLRVYHFHLPDEALAA
ncbi:MAG: hypothetical protein HC781_10645 [Leptolyngbyaceae cyanobacterium CSU_1_4]|nr:hypothetical protein [Leptolyngbyaceae cyanobacterium CSU_1_4]